MRVLFANQRLGRFFRCSAALVCVAFASGVLAERDLWDTAYFEAQFHLSHTLQPPAKYSDIRALPDFWHTDDRFSTSPVGWYRIGLSSKPEVGDSVRWSVFLPKFTQNVDVFFNGSFVGASHTQWIQSQQIDAVPINWNRPHLFNLPPTLWKPENNQLDIRLTTMRNWGLMAPIAVGPTGALQQEYDLRFFLQITINQISFWISLLLAMITFVYWHSDRQASQYLWFSISCLLWAVVAANNYLPKFPLPVPLWSSLFHVSVDFFGVGMLMFVHRYLGIRRVWLERILLGVLVVAAATYLCHYYWWQTKVNFYFHGITLALGFYNIAIAARAMLQSPSLRHLSLLAPLIVITLLTLHDNLFSRGIVGDAWFTQFYTMQLGTPLLMGFLLVVLSKDFVLALQSARRANSELEQRVAEIGRDLERSYQNQRDVERSRTELRERERIYQDLHDDLGSKLLSLVYGSTDTVQQDLARSAIADIRSIVSAHPDQGENPLEYAGAWHQEARERCEAAGLELSWHAQPVAIHLSQTSGYHLTRVIRELLSNVIRHAQATKVEIKLRVVTDQLLLDVLDNGCGMPAALPAQGSGLQGIRKRLRSIDGSVEWESSANGGTLVKLAVPY